MENNLNMILFIILKDKGHVMDLKMKMETMDYFQIVQIKFTMKLIVITVKMFTYNAF